MKKFLSCRKYACIVAFILSAISFSANAGDTLSFQVQAGANFARMNCKFVNTAIFENEANSITGANFGFRVERKVGKDFYLNSGVIFDMKGYEDNLTDLKLRLYYLTVPLHFGYRYKMADDIFFITDVGPYISYGIHANHKAFEDEIIDDLDFGLGFRFGLEFMKHWMVTMGGDFGLLNIGNMEVKNPDASKKGEYQFYNNARLHNFCFSTCLLYRF